MLWSRINILYRLGEEEYNFLEEIYNWLIDSNVSNE